MATLLFTFRALRYRLKKLGLPAAWPRHSRKAYRKAILADKKNAGQAINFVAIRKIGKSFLLPLKAEDIVKYI
jgi:3-dehydroquinate synthetase